MPKILNISKNYTVDKTFEESIEQFETIISTPFNDSKFSTFGNFVSTDPPELILMVKWASIGRPMFPDVSTKILARLFKSGSKTKIEITTKANPAVLAFFFFLLMASMIRLLTYNTSGDLKLAGVYFLFAALILEFDRVVKNILIAGFERDLASKKADDILERSL